MQFGGFQGAFCYSTVQVHLRHACAVPQNPAGRHSGPHTDVDFFQLRSYGSFLFDESACRVLRFRVPLQVHSNHLSEAVFKNAMRKLNLPREALVIMTKASKSTITAMSII